MRTTKIILQLSLVAVLLCLAVGCTGQDNPTTSEEGAEGVAGASKVAWEETWDAALSKARSEDKVVLVTFYADWCIWCKKLDETTLSDSEVVSLLAKKTVPVRLDIDGAGKELSDQYHVDGLPTVLVLNNDGTEIGRIPGYMPAEGFLEKIRSFVS